MIAFKTAALLFQRGSGLCGRLTCQYLNTPLRQEPQLGDHVRRLSHREAQLLDKLCQSANQTVLRKHILDSLWGNDSFFNSRNLDVYIARLCEYLRDDEQVQNITLKWVGDKRDCLLLPAVPSP
ncbi:MAG: helix-turn-helix domain-containing protein [Saprospiraceae bacterium]